MDGSRDCRFCDIVSGKHKAEVIFEDDEVFVFLDHAPLTTGHTLVVTRAHYEHMLEAPPELLAVVFARVQALSRALMSALGAQGVLVDSNVIVQQTVPHFHVHIVPRWNHDQLEGFSNTKTVTSRLSDVAGQIRRELQLS